MATGQEIVSYSASKLNQRVIVPYNPFGGQCVSYVDHVTTKFTGKNLAYTNAIDLLGLAKSRGFKVTRFTGSEIPKVSDIFVTATSNHPYGHTGVVESVDPTGSYFTTLEQNVDLNGDALENGGWVRRKHRTLYVDSTFTYDNDPNGLLPQYMLGWFTIASSTDSTPTKNTSSTSTLGKSVTRNGEVYSALTTNFNENVMYSNASKGVTDYGRTKIDRIVIHHNATTDKNVAMATWYESNRNWTSAHYEVANKELWGCLGENFVAFHSGNSDMNRRSIGIEHLNATGAPNWTISEDTYNTSAKLIADICKRYNLPCNSTTIIPHKSVSATACPGGIDMNKLITLAKKYYDKPTEAKVETNKIDKLENLGDLSMANIVMRSKSGKQGYVAITDGMGWGVGKIETVQLLEKNGYTSLVLDDGDFNRLWATANVKRKAYENLATVKGV